MQQRFDNKNLAEYTSLKVGGNAEHLVLTDTYEDTVDVLRHASKPIWLLGYGSNCLISDKGLPGTTIIWRKGNIALNEDVLVVDAGVWWDDLVQFCIDRNIWGFELMSEIPSSVGGAIFGNIAAYGQQVSDTLLWVEIYDTETGDINQIPATDIHFAYRESSLQNETNKKILRAGFSASQEPKHTLKYDSALVIAEELSLDTNSLADVRKIIIETRRRAGSIYHPNDESAERTAGSFFKNPLVSVEQAHELAKHDESGKTLERILNQSKVHGGNVQRASAAHVLLAAGFERGQTWGHVKLHDKHVLKVETLPGATAQEVYGVVKHIIDTTKQKLSIDIEPEVKFLNFD